MVEVLTHLATFIAGLAAGVVLKIRLDVRKSVSGNTASGNSQATVNQSGNTVQGHMSGRDVNVQG
jgi:hypothetical protein